MSPKYESQFTQRVIEAIEHARMDEGVSVQDLIDRSGIRRSSYFRKMRGDTTFTTEDVDAIARALGLDPFLLLQKAATVGGPSDNVGPRQSDYERVAWEDDGDTGEDLPE